MLGYANFLHVLDEGDIGNVAVAPEYRRQGGAERLCVSALAQFEAGEELRILGSVPEGSPAEGLLKKFALRREDNSLTITAPEKWRIKSHDA